MLKSEKEMVRSLTKRMQENPKCLEWKYKESLTPFLGWTSWNAEYSTTSKENAAIKVRRYSHSRGWLVAVSFTITIMSNRRGKELWDDFSVWPWKKSPIAQLFSFLEKQREEAVAHNKAVESVIPK